MRTLTDFCHCSASCCPFLHPVQVCVGDLPGGFAAYRETMTLIEQTPGAQALTLTLARIHTYTYNDTSSLHVCASWSSTNDASLLMMRYQSANELRRLRLQRVLRCTHSTATATATLLLSHLLQAW
jgi:hypothetical protein